ncbi:MAG: transcription termination/antitermination protein NusG [Propionibacteriaceae bacterium]
MTDMRDEFDAIDVDLNLDTTPVEDISDDIVLDLDDDDSEPVEESELNFDFDATVEEVKEDLTPLDLGEDAPTVVEDSATDSDLSPEHSAGIELAMEELRDRLASQPGDWYVIHTYSGMENRVKQNLESRVKTQNVEDEIFEAVVPTEQVDELRGNQKKTITRTVLPGYVLVRMDLTDKSWAVVRQTPSVTGFVGHAQSPVPISIEDVEKMLAPSVIAAATQATTGKPMKRKIEVADYKVGDSVQVDDGAFAGVHASIVEINPHNQRVKVLVEILGRETPIDLTFAQIKKI